MTIESSLERIAIALEKSLIEPRLVPDQRKVNGGDKVLMSDKLFPAIKPNEDLKLLHNQICTISSQVFAVIRNNKLNFEEKEGG